MIEKSVENYSRLSGIRATERTCAVIKPEGMKYKKQIEYRIQEEGFEIMQSRTIHLTPEQASEFFRDQYGFTCFPLLVASMASSPVCAMCLAKPNAIEDWKQLMGPYRVSEARLYWPDSLRAKYGDKTNDVLNAVHGSDCMETADRELHFFFPNMILEPIIHRPELDQYLDGILHPTILDGLDALCCAKPLEPVTFLADWYAMNNPNRPKQGMCIENIPDDPENQC